MTTGIQATTVTLDENQLRHAIRRVRERTLPAELDYWVKEYTKIGHRDAFLWLWCLEGVSLTSLSCVDPHLRGTNNITKVLGVMFDVLTDDIADGCGSPQLLERLLEIPFTETPPDFRSFSPEERAYADLTYRVWDTIITRARSYPRYDEFEELLRFDYRQLLNTMRYSQLVNGNPRLLNLVEHDLYFPHNMHMMISGTLDLMCSPEFDVSELGKMREVLWHAQSMGRIGNLVTTWEREIGETDWTSGVFARAIQIGAIDSDDLLEPDHERLRTAITSNNCEAFFLQRWHDHHAEITSRIDTIRSVDIDRLLGGLEELFTIHMGSRGLK